MIKKDVLFYVVAVTVFIIIGSLILFLPISEKYVELLYISGLVPLLAIVIEAWRDKRAYERDLGLQIRQQDNSLAIASHMANVVFDRQVDFCEKYFEKAYGTLIKMFSTGPAPFALDDAKDLANLRMKYSPWLSAKIENGLLPFEKALREIGVDAQLIKSNLPNVEHKIFVNKMFDAFTKVIQIDKLSNENTQEEAILSIINHLRDVLGVTELTVFRDSAIQTASKHVQINGD